MRIHPATLLIIPVVLALSSGPAAAGAIEDLGDVRAEVRIEAVGNLVAAGPAAVPVLEKALAHEAWLVRATAALALGRLGPTAAPARPALRAALTDDDPLVRVQAAMAAGRVFDRLPPELVTCLADPDPLVRVAAATGAGWLGPESVEILVPLLDDADTEVRTAAATALARQGADAAPAIPGLVRMLGRVGRHWPEGQCATDALVAMGETAVPALRAALDDGDQTVAWRASEALRRIEKFGLPALIDGLLKGGRETRYRAMMALREMGGGGRPASPALQELLKSKDRFFRLQAALTLARVDPSAPGIVPILEAGLTTDHSRHECKKALAAITGTPAAKPKTPAAPPAGPYPPVPQGPASDLLDRIADWGTAFPGFPDLRHVGMSHLGPGPWRKAQDVYRGILALGAKTLPAIRDALESDHPGKPKLAVSLAFDLGEEAAILAPHLERALTDEDAALRLGAAWALAKLGGSHARMVPVLLESLGSTKPTYSSSEEFFREAVRSRTVKALAMVGEAAVPALVTRLADPDLFLRVGAARALLRMDVERNDAREVLAQAVAATDSRLVREALRALGELGEAALPAVPAVRGALSHRDRDARHEAVLAMGKIGAKDEATVRALAGCLTDDDWENDMDALAALAAIGPAAAPAIPELIAAHARREMGVATRAAEALGEIGPAARKAVPAILENLERLQYLPLPPLVKIDPEKALVAAREALLAEGRYGLHQAVAALIAIGEPAVPVLVQGLEHGWSWTACLKALTTLGPRGPLRRDPHAEDLGRPDPRGAPDPEVGLTGRGPTHLLAGHCLAGLQPGDELLPGHGLDAWRNRMRRNTHSRASVDEDLVDCRPARGLLLECLHRPERHVPDRGPRECRSRHQGRDAARLPSRRAGGSPGRGPRCRACAHARLECEGPRRVARLVVRRAGMGRPIIVARMQRV